jgi:hypothetical protein
MEGLLGLPEGSRAKRCPRSGPLLLQPAPDRPAGRLHENPTLEAIPLWAFGNGELEFHAVTGCPASQDSYSSQKRRSFFRRRS